MPRMTSPRERAEDPMQACERAFADAQRIMSISQPAAELQSQVSFSLSLSRARARTDTHRRSLLTERQPD